MENQNENQRPPGQSGAQSSQGGAMETAEKIATTAMEVGKAAATAVVSGVESIVDKVMPKKPAAKKPAARKPAKRAAPKRKPAVKAKGRAAARKAAPKRGAAKAKGRKPVARKAARRSTKSKKR